MDVFRYKTPITFKLNGVLQSEKVLKQFQTGKIENV